MIKSISFAILGLGMFLGSAQAVVVAGRNQLFGPFDGGSLDPDYYHLSHVHVAAGNPSDYLTLNVVDGNSFSVGSVTLAIGFRAFILSAGDEFTAAYSGSHDFLASNMFGSHLHDPPYGIGTMFDVPLGGSIYIGFHVPNPLAQPEPFGDQFAWARISNVAGTLQLTAEATSINGGGIIVGTTTEIPEPSAPLLAGAASLIFLRRRR